MIGTTMALLGLAAASGGSKLLGGIFGAKSAKSAAELQAEAAAAAGAKVEGAVNATNPYVTDAAVQAGEGVKQAANWGAGDVTAKANAGADVVTGAPASGEGVKQAANWGAGDVTAKANAGADVVTGAVTGANKLLDPYATAGSTAADVLNKGITPGGDFNKTPGMADLTIDPGYAFRTQQGQLALERSGAAHGTIDSGGYLKDLTDYSQGVASQEYQKAFDRFQTSTQNRFANVSGVAGQGQTAARTQGTNLIGGGEFNAGLTTDASKFGAGLTFDASKFAGQAGIEATDLATGRSIDAARTAADFNMTGANAKAAGDVAATKSLWGGVSGAATDALGTYLYQRPNYIDPNVGQLPSPPQVDLTQWPQTMPPPPTVNRFARP